jgi:ComF family protein
VADALIDMVFPQHCVACGRAAPSAVALCERCRSALQPLGGLRCDVCGVPLVSEHELCVRCRSRRLHYDRHRSVFAYSGVAKQLIVAYKFGGRLRLAGLLCNYLVPLIPPAAVVVPVPASRRGRRRRGYDQVGRLATELERRHGVSVLRALTRTRGREQKRLDFDERSRNLFGAILLAPRFSAPWGPARMWVRGRGATVPHHVVLLDDVFTTGATVNECARVLRRAGAGRIDALTLAAD